MRYLLLAILFLIPTTALAITGDSSRFDFTNGQPAVVDDTTTTCDDTATIRYDFTSGVPTGVFDATANCVLAAQAPVVIPTVQVFIKEGSVVLKNGTVIVK